MSSVEVRGLRRAFGSVLALDGVDLDVPAGSLTAVLGPSGCGKSTLLRCLAGLERTDAGTVRLGERWVVGGPGEDPGEGPAGGGAGGRGGRRAEVPPHRRGVGLVPQEGALFPHLDVNGNAGYGLARAPRAERDARVGEVLELVGLAGLGRRMPHQLSGGQQQRVALARALAPRPAVVLLDEPFAALDAGLREGLRAQVREALRRDGTTGVLVTHDRAEALTTADRVALVRAGRVVQQGAPEDLYRWPVDPWAATFLGRGTVLAVRAAGTPASAPGGSSGWTTELGPVVVATPVVATEAATDAASDAPSDVASDAAPDTAWGPPVRVLVRPEQVRLHRPGGGAAGAPGVVLERSFTGARALLRVAVAAAGREPAPGSGEGLVVEAEVDAARDGLRAGDAVLVSVEGAVHGWPAPPGPSDRGVARG